jgi:hypothetical protein
MIEKKKQESQNNFFFKKSLMMKSEKKISQRKDINLVNFSNLWHGSANQKNYTWKNREVQSSKN